MTDKNELNQDLLSEALNSQLRTYLAEVANEPISNQLEDRVVNAPFTPKNRRPRFTWRAWLGGSLLVTAAAAAAIAGFAIAGLMLHSSNTSTPVARPTTSRPTFSTGNPVSTAAPIPSPTAATNQPTADQLKAVAQHVMSPTGQTCDTGLGSGKPVNVDNCPYTQRLKTLIDADYIKAFNGQQNSLGPNPALSATSGSCPNPSVSYTAVTTSSGGTVMLNTTCPSDPSANSSWQKLVIVSSNGSLLVDDILRDLGHNGNFKSIEPTAVTTAQQPPAGCQDHRGEQVVAVFITLNPTSPDPKCVVVDKGQAVAFDNNTGSPVTVVLGSRTRTGSGPGTGESTGFDGEVGSFTQTGLNKMQVSGYDANQYPAIWVY